MKLNNTNITICTTFLERLIGFSFKKKLNKCLCFPKCNSIHTFFMLNKIDVIMTDKNFRVLYIYKNLKPNKIILPKKKVFYTFEFPVNKFKITINEKLKIIL